MGLMKDFRMEYLLELWMDELLAMWMGLAKDFRMVEELGIHLVDLLDYQLVILMVDPLEIYWAVPLVVQMVIVTVA